MRIGVHIPTVGDLLATQSPGRIARAAEEAGADGVWVSDHLIGVADDRSPYPFSDDGRPPSWWRADISWFETLSVVSHLVAATESCSIGTAVLVIAQRNAIELAKAVATLDVLSHGRILLGVGVGWSAGEMEALGYEFTTRAARAREMVEVMRSCWMGQPPVFQGKHVTVPAGVFCYPTPVAGAVPILVGASSSNGLRWAAEQDGWVAVAHADQLDAAGLSRSLELIAKRREELGRMTLPFRRVLRLLVSPDMMDSQASAVEEVGNLGFDDVIIACPWEDLDRAQSLIAGLSTAGRQN